MKARLLTILLAILASVAQAWADSCVEIDGATIKNTCAACKRISMRELKPHSQRSSGLYSGATKELTLLSGASAPLGGTGLWAIVHMEACP